jgi:type IV secretion system protein VirB3
MRDIIFKGATRPAMVMGIPMLPLIVVGLSGVLLTLWALQLVGPLLAFAVLLATFACLVAMRVISKADDQKLNQMVLRLQSMAARRNANYWGAQSSSPLGYRKHL